MTRHEMVRRGDWIELASQTAYARDAYVLQTRHVGAVTYACCVFADRADVCLALAQWHEGAWAMERLRRLPPEEAVDYQYLFEQR